MEKVAQIIQMKFNETGAYTGCAADFPKRRNRRHTRRVAQHIPEFNVNRPFMFLIEHEPSGTVLFSGKVMNPNL